jgi:serine phosphatase RsbU (regulator of sigma subunit)
VQILFLKTNIDTASLEQLIIIIKEIHQIIIAGQVLHTIDLQEEVIIIAMAIREIITTILQGVRRPKLIVLQM